MKLIQHGQLDGSVEATVAFLGSFVAEYDEADRADALSELQGISNELSYVAAGQAISRVDMDEARALCKDAIDVLRKVTS